MPAGQVPEIGCRSLDARETLVIAMHLRQLRERDGKRHKRDERADIHHPSPCVATV
jgi:hypothetical protein